MYVCVFVYSSVTLGFLSLFPSKMVNAFSSGTGLAGILGSLIYVTFGEFTPTGLAGILGSLIIYVTPVNLLPSPPVWPGY
jgi:hypothetical protein